MERASEELVVRRQTAEESARQQAEALKKATQEPESIIIPAEPVPDIPVIPAQASRSP